MSPSLEKFLNKKTEFVWDDIIVYDRGIKRNT